MSDSGQAPAGGRRGARAGAALLAGAVGRQGEALLNAALARGGYASVHVLAEAPVSMGMAGLELCALDALPAVDDVLLYVTEAGDPVERSFHGRDAPFVPVTPERALAVARDAAAAGARRLLVLRPSPGWQQIGALQRALDDDIERALAALPFETVLVLRPVRPGRGPGGTWLRRLVNGYLSLQMLMMPRSIPVLTSDQVARAAFRALADAGPGVSVLLAEQLAALLEAARPGR